MIAEAQILITMGKNTFSVPLRKEKSSRKYLQYVTFILSSKIHVIVNLVFEIYDLGFSFITRDHREELVQLVLHFFQPTLEPFLYILCNQI